MNLYTKLAPLRIGKMNSKQKVKEKTWLSDKTLSFALTRALNVSNINLKRNTEKLSVTI